MGPQLDSCGRKMYTGGHVQICSLQWGRNLTVAEGYARERDAAAALKLQWGRNLTVAEGTTTAPFETKRPRCFNGAAT